MKNNLNNFKDSKIFQKNPDTSVESVPTSELNSITERKQTNSDKSSVLSKQETKHLNSEKNAAPALEENNDLNKNNNRQINKITNEQKSNDIKSHLSISNAMNSSLSEKSSSRYVLAENANLSLKFNKDQKDKSEEELSEISKKKEDKINNPKEKEEKIFETLKTSEKIIIVRFSFLILFFQTIIILLITLLVLVVKIQDKLKGKLWLTSIPGGLMVMLIILLTIFHILNVKIPDIYLILLSIIFTLGFGYIGLGLSCEYGKNEVISYITMICALDLSIFVYTFAVKKVFNFFGLFISLLFVGVAFGCLGYWLCDWLRLTYCLIGVVAAAIYLFFCSRNLIENKSIESCISGAIYFYYGFVDLILCKSYV